MSRYEMMSIVAASASALAAVAAVWVSYVVYKGQALLAQRQLIVPLWEYLRTLNEIDPARPITPDVVNAANTLELVALCCQGGMVDSEVVKRTFSDAFITHFNNITKCPELPGMEKDGKAVLIECPAARSFYFDLTRGSQSRGKS